MGCPVILETLVTFLAFVLVAWAIVATYDLVVWVLWKIVSSG